MEPGVQYALDLRRSIKDWEQLVRDLDLAWGQTYAVQTSTVERVEVAEAIQPMVQGLHDLAWYTLEDLKEEAKKRGIQIG